MKLSASQAAKRVGKSVPTITRAIKKGKLAAKPREGGVGWIIEASELFRVWPAVSSDNNVNPSILDSENHALQREISLLREMLDDTKADRDHWRAQAHKITALIECQSPYQRRSKNLPDGGIKAGHLPPLVLGASDRVG